MKELNPEVIAERKKKYAASRKASKFAKKAKMSPDELLIATRKATMATKTSRHNTSLKKTGKVTASRVRLDDEKKRQRKAMIALKIIGMGLNTDIPTELFQKRNGGVAVPEASETVLWQMNATSEPRQLRFFGPPRITGSKSKVPDDGATIFEIKTDSTGVQTIWVLCVFSTYSLAEICMGWKVGRVSVALRNNKGIVHGVKDGRVYFVRKFHDKSLKLAIED
jgi:hypothetical protein